MSLLFHPFKEDPERRTTGIGEWRGGDGCGQCSRARHEHTSEVRHDASEWNASDLADEIDGQLRACWHALRQARHDHDTLAETYMEKRLSLYFELRSIGLQRESGGSLACTLRRQRERLVFGHELARAAG